MFPKGLRTSSAGVAGEKQKKKWYQKTWVKFVLIVVAILVVGGSVMAWKTGSVLTKISGGKGGFFSSLTSMVPGMEKELKGEKEDRINVLLLGMRGENVPGGGLLADTIMLVSIKPKENKVSFISVPRDLYVTVPGTSDRQKINAVHAYGQEKNPKGGGLEDMKTIIGEITGLPIHYAASINFQGFTSLVDALGGIKVTLDQPFEEPLQFNEPHVCDPYVFTVPTGKFEIKRRKGVGKITAQYPLCTNPNTECGGDFKLPAGTSNLTGSQALCFVRSRVTSSDFERAKRQQIVIQEIKDKATSIGTLTDFEKINGMLNALGDNVRTDMEPWEMKLLFDRYQKMQTPQIFQRVLENSNEGLLYHPETTDETGYILLPIGDNYNQIHDMAQNIFILPAQTDIKPR